MPVPTQTMWTGKQPLREWTYAAASGGIVNTTSNANVQTAAAADARHIVTACQIMAEALGTATEFVIKDGASIIWRTKIGTGGLPFECINFDPPLRCSNGNALNIATITASVTGAVYANLQGYTI